MSDTFDDVQSPDLKFDVRIVPHSIRRKKLTWEDVEADNAELPDEADEAVESAVEFTTPFADRAKKADAES